MENKDKPVSVDPREVALFSSLASRWWDAAGPFAPLHRMSHARMEFVRAAMLLQSGGAGGSDGSGDGGGDLELPGAGLRVLDIGCGGGLLSEPMRRLGAAVTGVDASSEAIEAARSHAALSGLKIDYHVGAAEDFVRQMSPKTPPKTPAQTSPQIGGFDMVVASEVIEHVVDPAEFVAMIAHLVRPGGIVVLTTLNRSIRALVTAKFMAEYVLRLLPAGSHDWQKFITPEELRGLLSDAGFTLQLERGICYDVIRNRFDLGADMSVNYAMAARLNTPGER